MTPRHWIMLACSMLVAACSSGPPVPDWKLNAQSALERATEAYLVGNTRIEAAEFARARAEVARTGQATLVARTELTRCAIRVASLVFEPCAGFEPLRADAAEPERAYADYLAARLQPVDAALLPPQHRAVAAGGAAITGIEDPVARLIAAGVLLQTGRASLAVVAQAVETASAQGWRRPLLAWLGVQARLAEQGGDAAEAERVRRRMALVGGAP